MGPHPSKKTDLDLHQHDADPQHWFMEAHSGVVEAHNGAMEAQNGAMEADHRVVEIQKWSWGGSPLSC